MELANWLDLAPTGDRGQRVEVKGRVGGLRSENLRFGFQSNDFSDLLFLGISQNQWYW